MTDDNSDDGDGLPDPDDVIAGAGREPENGIGDDLPEPDHILQVHKRIEEEYDLTHTGAAVAAPRLKFERLLEDVDEYEGPYMRAAALLRMVLTAHYFEDGNKRTAWATTRVYLENQGYVPADRSKRVERVLRNIRQFEIDEIAEWLETGTIDDDRFHPR